MTRECSNAVQIQKSLKVNDDIEVSASTVRRALKRNGLAAQVKRKKPLLSKKHREKCLNFAKRYKDWTVSDWNKVVWSDESKFQIFGSDTRQYCWKRPKDPLQDAHVKPTVKFGGGSIFPPQSSDLNPIEHLWNDIDRHLRALDIEIRGKDMLWEQISNVWNETTLEACSKLIETMPERINDVIKAKGGYTRW
ncbi:transposable element Tcb1 transposase [Rhizophagus clarus]|uniref:Transposable element Tcb1 transposase n=1 Tax=Rhizophagus clarus TaxID=94130 RepID=A0A8H3L6Q4_9GLOM|nr:transposable element Tcb1 transposase [Rhizophagus clarus]